MPDGMRLPLRRWLPADGGSPRAVILALHGFNDYSTAFETPAAEWAEHGLATYAYDQRGFGRTADAGYWPGAAALIDDLKNAIALIGARYPKTPLIVLGESMGGAVVAAAEAEAKLPVDGLVLVAPAVRGRTTMNPFYRATLYLAAHLVPWVELTGRGLHIVATDNREVLIRMQADPYVIKSTRIDAIWGLVDLMDRALVAAPALPARTLVVYGTHDQVMPDDSLAQFVAQLRPAVRTAVYPSGYHMLLRDLGAAPVRDDIVAWFDHPDAPLPSGADRSAESFFGLSAASIGQPSAGN
jgi:alpha-beta hydrolase superfamily lysophospholipase